MSSPDGLVSGDAQEIAELKSEIAGLKTQLTEFEHMRQILQEEHSFRKGVIERAAEGICACHYIPKSPFIRFTLWNPRMEEITGYSREQINRLGWYQTLYPDDENRELARQRMTKMREGEDLLNERWEITRADGQKKTLGISTSILKAQDGRAHVLALMQDITDQEKYRRQIENRLTSLEGLLSICASCKRIRTEKNDWQELEMYISSHSDAMFSHGICPDCMQELYPNL